MDVIEQERLKCEKLDTIALSITRRFERNPAVFHSNQTKYRDASFPTNLPSSVNISELAHKNSLFKVDKPLRSKKQILAQQHEINRFCKVFKDTKSHIKERKDFDRDLVEIAKNELGDQDEVDFLKFDSFVNSIIHASDNSTDDSEKKPLAHSTRGNSVESEFSMFPHPLQILSEAAQDININSFFQREENYGAFLNLTRYYTLWLNVIKSSDFTYLEFLRSTIGTFKQHDYAYILSNKNVRDSPQYYSFLLQLNNYLTNFIKNKFPLFPYEAFEKQKIGDKLESFLQSGLNLGSRERDSTANNYCLVCDESVPTEASHYNVSKESHWQNKKHIRNLEKRKSVCLQELKLHMFCCGLLSEIIDNTESFTEMKLSYTNKERLSELGKLGQLYEEDLYTQKELEFDQHLESEKQRSKFERDESTLPQSKEYGNTDPKVSASGGDQGSAEIPKWLRKLKKLDQEYLCEICGNVTYKGYKPFQKHFFESKHVIGLRCLGYSGSPLQFKGIVKISDMKVLQNKLFKTLFPIDKTNVAQKTDTVNEVSKPGSASNQWFIEIEDSQGNIVKKK
ncbi:hypothetical protein ACO0QE_001450 [Hanseniaspora vineae]